MRSPLAGRHAHLHVLLEGGVGHDDRPGHVRVAKQCALEGNLLLLR